ncbi:hypothetical protein [Paraburkholderia sediminicola]|uniref:hypothetical protein n=1 Tax=Paraburkholderia sediminicola TaxID=458836 RepID=UPI0038BD8600
MKMQVSDSNFGNELSDLIAKLDSFPKLTAPCSAGASLNTQPPAKNDAVLSVAATKSATTGERKGRGGERCPGSIRRLCSPTLSRKAIATPTAPTPNTCSQPHATDRRTSAQLLVARDGTIYGLDVVTDEVAREPGWKQAGDYVDTWSKVFRPDSPFLLVSSEQQFQRLRLRLSTLPRKDVRNAINAWLISMLATHVSNPKTAYRIKLITKLPNEWDQIRVRLRPLRSESTSRQSADAARFSRSQEAEIRGGQSYRLAQKRLQELWVPTPPSRSNFIQTRS